MAGQEEISTQREPCPWRILDDCGGAFAMGAIGGAIWHGIKGYRTAPRGMKGRESIAAIKLRAPTVGGNFAVWGGLFSTFDCTLIALRGHEDPWNAIASGAMTGGVLAARLGMKASLKSAAAGGIILACIEGLTIAINRYQTDQAKPQLPEMPSDPLSQPPSQAGAW